MQRRAAALYVAFFVLVGAASYTLIVTGEEPSVEIQDPEHTLEANESVTLDGQQYNLTSIENGTTPTGQFQWTNESARYTATWQNNSTVTLGADNVTYRVLIPNNTTAGSGAGGNVTEFRLVEQVNGTQAEPEVRRFSVGETFDYEGNQTTVASVQPQRAVLAWNAPRTLTVDATGGSNVTLGDTTYLAFFPNNSTLYLTQNFQNYQETQTAIAEYNEQMIGLWGVVILCGAVAVLLTGLAYMPSRY